LKDEGDGSVSALLRPGFRELGWVGRGAGQARVLALCIGEFLLDVAMTVQTQLSTVGRETSWRLLFKLWAMVAT
jgi:hypothetical protein